MTRAVVARRQGDDFQARLFWLKSASLLDPESPIIRVAYEKGPRGFDDLLVEYDRDCAPRDHNGQPIYRKYLQCKWHVSAGAFGYRDLVDPAFISAEKSSFLQRAHEAQRLYAPDGLGCQFKLITNWRLRHDDPLIELVRMESGAIDLRKLALGKTDRSRMGKVRKLWGKHLDLGCNRLNRLLRVVAIWESPSLLQDLRNRLDERFAFVGLKRIGANQAGFCYDDLVAKLHAQGRADFDCQGFREMCRQEGILERDDLFTRGEKWSLSRIEGRSMSGGEATPSFFTIGVRTFMHPIDNLEERCSRSLDLVPHFDGRQIKDQSAWRGEIYPELREFVLRAAGKSDCLRVVLDAHVSVAFAVGTLLNVKSGKAVEIEQRTAGRHWWSADDAMETADWPDLTFGKDIRDLGKSEIAVAISLTHNVSGTVRSYVTRKLPQVGLVLHCCPNGAPSGQFVQCGCHAVRLAEAITAKLREHNQLNLSRLHFFISGPNAFAFFLGQQSAGLGQIAIWEYDFEGRGSGTYSLGLEIPVE